MMGFRAFSKDRGWQVTPPENPDDLSSVIDPKTDWLSQEFLRENNFDCSLDHSNHHLSRDQLKFWIEGTNAFGDEEHYLFVDIGLNDCKNVFIRNSYEELDQIVRKSIFSPVLIFSAKSSVGMFCSDDDFTLFFGKKSNLESILGVSVDLMNRQFVNDVHGYSNCSLKKVLELAANIYCC